MIEDHEKKLAEATFTVLVTPSRDLPGQWVAHCLNIDLVTQGESIQHAFAMARESIVMVVEDDLRRGKDPFERDPAPPECWTQLVLLHQFGRPLSTIADKSKIRAVATLVQVVVPIDDLPEHARPPEVEMMPPAWQIASLEELRQSQGAHC